MRPKKAQLENTHIEIKYPPPTPVAPVSSGGPLQPIQKHTVSQLAARKILYISNIYLYTPGFKLDQKVL